MASSVAGRKAAGAGRSDLEVSDARAAAGRVDRPPALCPLAVPPAAHAPALQLFSLITHPLLNFGFYFVTFNQLCFRNVS